MLRQEVQQILNRAASPADRQFFKNLSDQDEEHDHQRREHLPDSERRYKRDGHRQFHGHAPGQKIGESFTKYRVAADQDGRKANDIEVRQRLPEPQPRYRDCQSDETDPAQFNPLQVLAVCLVFLLMVKRV